MFERVKRSRERPCVHRWPLIPIKVHTLKTSRTSDYVLTRLHKASLNNIISVSTSKIPAVFDNRHTPQVQRLPAEFISTHTRTDDVSFGLPTMVHNYHEANSSIRFAPHAQSCNKNHMYGKRTDAHHAIKITNQNQFEFRTNLDTTSYHDTWQWNSMQLSHQIVIPSYGIVASANRDITASLLLKNLYLINKRLGTSRLITFLSNKNCSHYGHIKTQKCIRRKNALAAPCRRHKPSLNRSGRDAPWFVSSLVINDDPLAN